MIEVHAGTICPGCGFTEEIFAKAFQLGCPQCYETFAEALSTMLPKLHFGGRHAGKAPGRLLDPAAALRRELFAIEVMLRFPEGAANRTDALLDRWKEIHDRLDRPARDSS